MQAMYKQDPKFTADIVVNISVKDDNTIPNSKV